MYLRCRLVCSVHHCSRFPTVPKLHELLHVRGVEPNGRIAPQARPKRGNICEYGFIGTCGTERLVSFLGLIACGPVLALVLVVPGTTTAKAAIVRESFRPDYAHWV